MTGMTRVGSKEGVDTLKEDLLTLFEWADNWQMKFNVGMCSVVGMGFNNININLYSCLFLCFVFALNLFCCVPRFWCPANLFSYLVKFCVNVINIHVG